VSERYLTWIDGAEAVVELNEVDGEHVAATVTATVEEGEPAAEPVKVVFERKVMIDGSWLLNLPDGRSRSIRVLPDGKGNFEMALPKDVRFSVQAMSERDAWMGGAGAGGADEGEVTVSMPGAVVKVLVAIGDSVEEGQPVLVIEAMKMENEVKSGRTGVVTAIHVNEGDSVEADQVLLEVGEAGEADG